MPYFQLEANGAARLSCGSSAARYTEPHSANHDDKFSPFSLGRARKREKDQAGKENIAFQGSLLPPKDLAKPSKVDVISKIKRVPVFFQVSQTKYNKYAHQVRNLPQYWTHLQYVCPMKTDLNSCSS